MTSTPPKLQACTSSVQAVPGIALMRRASTLARVQAHTSNLANCIFLPPGSAVVELIQRFWTWMALDKSFKDQTDQLADVHHFAWRAHHKNQTVYLNPRDLERCAC